MASNPYVNKVELADGTVKLDLTGDTVEAGKMLSGITAHDQRGAPVTGNIPSKAAATYNAKTSDQTIAAGQYLSGKQTIRKITTTNIDAANIKSGVNVRVGDSGSATRIKNVTGTFTEASTVSSGQTAAGVAQILSGYSAWVDGAEVLGTYNPGAAYYPVGSYWTTDDPEAAPGTVLGIGTWQRVKTAEPNWEELDTLTKTWNGLTTGTWNDMADDIPHYYIWKRTA